MVAYHRSFVLRAICTDSRSIFYSKARQYSSRMHTARLATVRVSVTTTTCQYCVGGQGAGGKVLKLKKSPVMTTRCEGCGRGRLGRCQREGYGRMGGWEG